MKSGIILITLLEVLFLTCCVSTSTVLEKEQEILKSILDPEKYDPSLRASSNGTGPVVVRINMYIRSIDNIDDMNRDYSLQVTFRQFWKDERLSYHKHLEANDEIKYLSVHNPDKVWTPDVFFSNEKNGHFHNIVVPNTLLRIFPNGDVLCSTRISLKLKCPMDLKYYPMDRPICSLILASYGYTTKDLVFLWKDMDPIQITKIFDSPGFSLKKFFTDYCTSKTNTGEYSCLKLDLLFSREFHHYFMEIYMPSIIFVMMSWVCFWLDQKATTARVLVWMTVFLAFTMKTGFIRNEVPTTAYSTAYDIWITTCYIFLVVVLLEVATVSFFFSCRVRRSTSEKTSGDNDCIKKRNRSEDVQQQQTNAVFRLCRRFLRRYPLPESKIDRISCVLFPLVFAIFNLIYWTSTAHHFD